MCIDDDRFLEDDHTQRENRKFSPQFKFRVGDEIQFNKTTFFIYECNEHYVTIHIRKKYITADSMKFMENFYDAVYHGPVLDWMDGSHVTFKRKN